MDASTRTPLSTSELEAVRQRRAELLETLGVLERCLAAPAGDRTVLWGERLHAAVERLASDFALHVEVTEGPSGLHQEIITADVRLANQVSALAAEHEPVAAEIAALSAATLPPVSESQVGDLREQGTTLLSRLIRHRQRGADLVYEAFACDIGGCD
jgi:hypothetical protein